jgi:hypothetical protein
MDSTLVTTATGDDPRAGLRAVRSLRELADRLETLQVERCGDVGAEVSFTPVLVVDGVRITHVIAELLDNAHR